MRTGGGEFVICHLGWRVGTLVIALFTMMFMCPESKYVDPPQSILNDPCQNLVRLCTQNHLQRQTAVTAYLKSELLLLFAFNAIQRQTAVTAYLKSKQLLLFVFAMHYTHTSPPSAVRDRLMKNTVKYGVDLFHYNPHIRQGTGDLSHGVLVNYADGQFMNHLYV